MKEEWRKYKTQEDEHVTYSKSGSADGIGIFVLILAVAVLCNMAYSFATASRVDLLEERYEIPHVPVR